MAVPSKIGLKIDAKGDEVGLLQGYLKRFGYVRPDEEAPYGVKVDLQKATEEPERNVFDNTTQEALKRFQAFNSLPVTGVLDKATVNLMLKPRCGLPDFVVSEGQTEDYVYGGKKWGKLALTYRFQNYTSDLSQSVVRRAIQDAFRQWSSVTPLSFGEVSSGGDIRVLFGARAHDDPRCSTDSSYFFDGPSGVLAHAYYPEDGRCHFDEDERWTDNDPPSGIDLASVAVHELGHILGLAHSNDTQAVMYAYYGGRRRSLRSDDITGIQSIYGAAQWRYNQRILGLWTNYQSKNAWVYVQNLGWKKLNSSNADAVTNLLAIATSAKANNRVVNFYEKNSKITEMYLW